MMKYQSRPLLSALHAKDEYHYKSPLNSSSHAQNGRHSAEDIFIYAFYERKGLYFY